MDLSAEPEAQLVIEGNASQQLGTLQESEEPPKPMAEPSVVPQKTAAKNKERKFPELPPGVYPPVDLHLNFVEKAEAAQQLGLDLPGWMTLRLGSLVSCVVSMLTASVS